MEQERQSDYEIREATIDDVKPIRTMHGQSWRDTYRNDELGVTKEWLAEETTKWLTSEWMDKSYQKMSEVFADPKQFYRVALQSDRVVGMVHVLTKEDGTKHLGALYTSTETHGSGLAQELMSLADSFVGDDEIDLEVVDYNERAKAFYRKCGFVDAGKTEELFRDKMPVLRMVRRAGSRSDYCKYDKKGEYDEV
jgi:ribosomal protein S18 acetylase RimI-like enzyme